jgi:hypothetical protein
MRLPSVTDQIYIKAQRIRSIEEKGEARVNEDVNSEFIGIANYALIALIQLELPPVQIESSLLSEDTVMKMYKKHVKFARQLLSNKNHDYGEAWRKMKVSSITDIILMKVLRIKSIEDNKGKILASEGVDANFYDIFNYSIFALIKLLGEKNYDTDL